MTSSRGDAGEHAGGWEDAAAIIELLATDVVRLGGVALRGRPGSARDGVMGWLRDALPPSTPIVRLPIHVTDDRLLGGLSLAATLRDGKPVFERGLLARADGGVVVAAMAERLGSNVTAHLCKALDEGALVVERDGLAARSPCAIGIVALDEGLDDERVPTALLDRLAFHLDLTRLEGAPVAEVDPERVARARALLPEVTVPTDAIDALCGAAVALGIRSLRAPLLAAIASTVCAALAGRRRVEEADVVFCARVVLGPRATQRPVSPEEDEPAPPPPPDDAPDDAEREAQAPTGALPEMVLEAAKSGIPAGLLDALAGGLTARGPTRSRGHAGAARKSLSGGRPAGVRARAPADGERLNVVETLRAAAPWQRIRRAARPAAGPALRVEVRKDDFRVSVFEQRAETRIVFAVDASGSAALQRLAEAKGAVEQVLADCYARRDHVALIAFRQTSATVLLPPTRSLARVRRSLANLAGGGTTPLAAGIDAALALAVDAEAHGATPVIVLMTDGRANIGRQGREGSGPATADATDAARAVRAAGIRALFLDTSPRPRPLARQLATEMGARYLPLPYLDEVGVSAQIRALAREGS